MQTKLKTAKTNAGGFQQRLCSADDGVYVTPDGQYYIKWKGMMFYSDGGTTVRPIFAGDPINESGMLVQKSYDRVFSVVFSPQKK